jgi:hypothetical protein
MEPAVLIQVDENPNCETCEGQVFQPRTEPQVVARVRLERGGADCWYEITGLEAEGRPCPAMATLVDDSGEGICYLVFGGAWGLRLRSPSSSDSWDMQDASQFGRPFLLLGGNGEDLKFQ